MTAPSSLPPLLRWLSSFLVALVVLGPGALQAEDSLPAEDLSLSPGASLEREIGGGETRSFNLRLEAGTFVFLEIPQRGLSLSSTLLPPDGSTAVAAGAGGKLLESHLLAAVSGREGTYRLNVAVQGSRSRRGKLVVRVLAVRPAGAGDEARVRGAQALTQARLLFDQEDATSQVEGLLQKSLAAWQEAADSRGEVEALLQEADLRSEQADLPGALSWAQKALDRSRQSGFSEGAARAFYMLGFCSHQQARYEEAEGFYRNSLESWKQTGGTYEQAFVLQALGNSYFLDKKDLEQARETFEQALSLSEAAGDAGLRARAMSGIGAYHYQQYRLGKAREIWEQALELSREGEDQEAEASLDQNLAAVYQNQGQLQKALDLFTRVVERIPPKESGMKRYNMGNLYLELGNPERALDNYKLSLQAFQAKADAEYTANARIGLGWALQRLGKPEEALAEYERARQGLPRESWNVLHSIGLAQVTLGQRGPGLESLSRALELARSNGDRSREAATLLSLGTAHARLGQPEKALEHLGEAVRIGREIGYQSAVAFALLQRAELYQSRGQLKEGLADIESALDVIESTRRNIPGDQLRIGFSAAKRSFYDLDVGLLMQLDRLQPGAGYRNRAFETSERARARGLLDLLAEGKIDVRQGFDPDLVRQEDEISDRISLLQGQLRSKGIQQERLQKILAEIKDLEERRNEVELNIQARNKRYAEVRYPVPLRLEEIQRRVLDEHTVLLEYVLGSASSVLFAVTRDRIETYQLPASSEIARQVRRLREAVEKESPFKRKEYLEAAFQLYQALVSPAAEVLKGKDALLIVPDGALYYMPFEALLMESAGDQRNQDLHYLLKAYSVAYIPSASVLAGLREPRQEPAVANRMQIAAFAPFASAGEAQAFQGTGSGQGSSPDLTRWSFAALPGSRKEVQEIANLYPGQTLSFFGDQADEEIVTHDPAVATARRLHFATHAQIDEAHPESSALVLAQRPGDDGLLETREIFNLRLSAELAVLSACQTGMGKEVTGEGLVGLTRAFFYAGVPSLVVSLWNVVDGSTPGLMLDFYRNQDRLHDKAKALQAAKLTMIARGTFAHPSYWAPFILLGEPR